MDWSPVAALDPELQRSLRELAEPPRAGHARADGDGPASEQPPASLGQTRCSVFAPDERSPYRFVYAEDSRDRFQQVGILTPELSYFCCADAECLHAPSPFFLVHYDLLEPVLRTYGRMKPLSQGAWDRIGFPRVGLARQDNLTDFVSTFAAAELREEHVVLGADDRIEEALEAACGLGRRACLLHHCCIGMVTGVDWQGISRRVERRSGVAIVHDANVGLATFHADLAAQIAAEPTAPAVAAHPPRRLNLVGFRDDPGTRELAALLTSLGFEVVGQPIPDLTALTLPELQQADLQVLHPVPEYDRLYDDVFRRLGTPALAPAAPYGFARSLRWLHTIAQHGEVELSTHPRWLAYYEPLQATFAALQARARGHRIGLVLTPEQGARMAIDAEAELPLPIPLLPLLAEMGFGVDVLLAPAPASRKRSTAEPDGTRSYSVTTAATLEEVDGWLADPERRLIYSDLKRDLRVTGHGKAPFSLWLFELGFEGACRTAEALVRLCELDYFHRYRHHRRWPCAPLGG